jgi:hypothetical protein
MIIFCWPPGHISLPGNQTGDPPKILLLMKCLWQTEPLELTSVPPILSMVCTIRGKIYGCLYRETNCEM